MKIQNSKAIAQGMKMGLPIMFGYLAVGFSLGIAARGAHMTPFQGFLASFTNNASAGEYAAFTLIAANATYAEVALMTLIANARYLLMSCALSQKFSPDTKFFHRLIIGYDVTDEIFGVTIAKPGALNPYYVYGVMLVALPGWSIGTMCGVAAGSILPVSVLNALSVALYGMFLAIIIPPARKSRVIASLIVICFISSYLFSRLPYLSKISSGTRTIILTIVIAGAAAFFFPLKDDPYADAEADDEDGNAGGQAAAKACMPADGGTDPAAPSGGEAGK